MSPYPQFETNLMLNRKVIKLLWQLKIAKAHGKNYIKVRPPLVCHLLRNRLLVIYCHTSKNLEKIVQVRKNYGNFLKILNCRPSLLHSYNFADHLKMLKFQPNFSKMERTDLVWEFLWCSIFSLKYFTNFKHKLLMWGGYYQITSLFSELALRLTGDLWHNKNISIKSDFIGVHWALWKQYPLNWII